MKQKTKYNILLCEDDPNLGMVLKNFLELNDYDVTLERDGRLGLVAFMQNKFDLCLLDIMMPRVDGFKLAEDIREIDPEIPLFFLSAKTMKEDIIEGYRLGADDYITKPFDSEVLLAKIQTIIKRNDEQNAYNESLEYDFGSYHLVPRLRELTNNGTTVKLTAKETALLRLLVTNKNDLLTREEALKKVWGSDSYFNARSMDVYVAKLRKFFSEESGILIKNIHGQGFKMIVPE
jgi:DNA-binding response OmpR family regulator